MNMPERRRWFSGAVSLEKLNGFLPGPGHHRLQPSTASHVQSSEDQAAYEQDEWPQDSAVTRLGSVYAVTLSRDCPRQLLTALQPGEVLELVPDANLHGDPVVRIEYGIFQVGYLACAQRSLLWRLLTKNFHVFGRVARIETTATSQTLWISVYLGE